MELWIRSQDKRTLINTRRIDVDDNNIIVWDEGRYADEIFLGTYKTEKRALEVLDEIQKLLMPISEYKQEIDNLTINYKNSIDTAIYEMPSE